jgi:glutathione-specific gamma-glutamylcyclotransferase
MAASLAIESQVLRGEHRNSSVVGVRPPQFVEGANPLVPFDEFLPRSSKQSVWIFAYGSLIWNPEFPVRRRSLARVYGFHRALCMRSTLYRGTVEAPGLVLGLKPGGSCLGAVLEIDPAHTQSALEKLWFREMRGNIYTPRSVQCEIFKPTKPTQTQLDWQTGAAIRSTSVQAVTFIANCSSPAYTPDLCPDEATRRVANCRGERGTNLEYVGNTVRHLEAMGIHDRALWRLYSDSVKRCK